MRSAWWINRQINDQFVRKAIQNDYRSRSAFKLLEIHEKYNLIRAGNAILDCGAAPGGWSEATMNVLQSYDTGNTKSSLLVAADIKRFDLIAGAICLHPLNLSSPIALERIQKILANNGRHYFDLILSDMAPTMTGQADADHSNSINLCKSVLEISETTLCHNGKLLLKTFQGSELPLLKTAIQARFSQPVRVIKPAASRQISRELYLLCTGYKRH